MATPTTINLNDSTPAAPSGRQNIAWLSDTNTPRNVSANFPVLSVFDPSGSGHASGLVPDPGATAGATKFLREDATWDVPAGGAVFVASGSGHAAGLVPDPGATAGAVKFLREDATWDVPGGSGPSSATSSTVSLTTASLATDAAESGTITPPANLSALVGITSSCAAQVSLYPSAAAAALAASGGVLSTSAWTVTATHDNGAGYLAPNVIDGNASTYWWSGQSIPQSLLVDMGSAQTISAVSIAPSSTFSSDEPLACTVYSSPDGITYTAQGSATTAIAGSTLTVTLTTPVTVRYFKVTVTNSTSGGGGWTQVGTLIAYGILAAPICNVYVSPTVPAQITPAAIAVNTDGPSTATLYYTIQNLDTVQAVTAVFQFFSWL